MTKKERRSATRAADGGTIGTCPGCGAWPCSSLWRQPCPRCAEEVCRVCREDCDHDRANGTRCLLNPPAVTENPWPARIQQWQAELASGQRQSAFPPPEKDLLRQGQARTKEEP
jgi:hypothetical protein